MGSPDYFYAAADAIRGDELSIAKQEFNHLTHVMRKQVGDTIVAVDGRGNAYRAEIKEIHAGSARCSILEKYSRIHEPGIDVSLAVALLKNPSRFDVLVEKTTELGVNRILPLITERTIPDHGKRERWQKIALGAMKQSRRCFLPDIAEPVSFSNYLESVSHDGLLAIAHEGVQKPLLRAVTGSHSSISVCIGPEGGFTDLEVQAATSAGFTAVSLGERRLRTETAAIVAGAIALA